MEQRAAASSPAGDNEVSPAPPLPDLPTKLSSLSLGDDNSDPSSIWGSAPSSSAPIHISASSTSSPYSTTYQTYRKPEGYAADSLADLDPFSPSSSQPWSDQTSLGSGNSAHTTAQQLRSTSGPTLGSTVTPSSRLELLDDSPSPSPTSSIHPLPSPPPPPIENEAPPIPLKVAKLLGPGPAPVSSGFLGGMFRTASGSGTAGGNALALPGATGSGTVSAVEEKEGLRVEFNEKVAPPTTPRHPTPLASTSDSPVPSSLSNPLASIASVFRSATSSKNSSLPGTPPSSSPPRKVAFPEAARRKESGGKEMEKEKGKLKELESEAEAVFDFNKFMEQMRSRSADPIAKYLRSFLKEFSRRPPVSTADQIRIINDFLDFISVKMRAVEPWKEILADKDGERAEAEFDMAMEAMEKLVMNRVWHLTFTPALDLSLLPGHVSPTDDLERDHVLSQRIRLFSWIQPCHLDLPVSPPTSPTSSQQMSPSASSNDGDSVGSSEKRRGKEGGPAAKQKQAQGFLEFAQRELIKINQYKAPRDKLICILNSCKVIFGLMKHVSSDEGADAFVPFLIYIVLKANPEHLVSNIQYIQRFRNPEKLSGEGGYYLSSLSGAISFIETMDASSLSHITQSEFETHVEEAILNLPVDPEEQALRMPRLPSQSPTANLRPSTPADLSTGTDSDSPNLIQQPGLSNATKSFLLRSSDSVERIVSKPIDALGRIFDQFDAVLPQPANVHPSTSPHAGPPPLRRNYPTYTGGQNRSVEVASPTRGALRSPQGENPHAGLYVSDRVSVSEVTEEIDRQHEEQRLAAIETLVSIFPQLEKEVLEMVLLSNGGDMARTIDSLLDMS